jgi:hypothetical protein
VDKISDFVELYSQLNPQVAAVAPHQVQVPSNNGKSIKRFIFDRIRDKLVSVEPAADGRSGD